MLNHELKRLRKERHLTQTQLAEQLNLSQATIASWENGSRRPDLDFLPTLANFYGITSDELLGLDKNNDQQTPTIPKTAEAKILCSGIDKMPKDKREKALNMVRIMFEEYADYFNEEGNDNDAE